MAEPMNWHSRSTGSYAQEHPPNNERQPRLLILATFGLGSIVIVLGLIDAAAHLLKFVTPPVLLGFGVGLIGMALGKREGR